MRGGELAPQRLCVQALLWHAPSMASSSLEGVSVSVPAGGSESKRGPHDSAVAQLAVSISHELRNPLCTIEASAYLISQRLQQLGVQDDGIQRHLDKVRTQVQRCSQVLSELAQSTRGQKNDSPHDVTDERIEGVQTSCSRSES